MKPPIVEAWKSGFEDKSGKYTLEKRADIPILASGGRKVVRSRRYDPAVRVRGV